MNWALEQRSEGFQVIYRAWGMARCPGGRLAPIGRQQRKAWQRCWVQKEHISIEELKSPPWRWRAGWGWGSWQVTWSLVDIYWQDCGKPPDKAEWGATSSDLQFSKITLSAEWSDSARMFMKKPTPWVRERPRCGCGPGAKPLFTAAWPEYFGDISPGTFLRRWQYAVGTRDSDVKQLTEMRHHDGSRHRSQLTPLCQAGHWDGWPLLSCLSSTHRSLDRQTILQQRSVTSRPAFQPHCSDFSDNCSHSYEGYG